MNQLYDVAREAELGAGVAWVDDPIYIVFCDGEYLFAADHTTLADVPSEARVVYSAALTSKAVTDGYATAESFDLELPLGRTITQMVVYRALGADDECPLVAHIDTGFGLPYDTNAGALRLEFDARGLFRA